MWNACYPRHLYILRSLNTCRHSWKCFWVTCHTLYRSTHRVPCRAQKQQCLPCGSFHGIFSSVGECQMWPSEALLACPCYKTIWSFWRLQKEREKEKEIVKLASKLFLGSVPYTANILQRTQFWAALRCYMKPVPNMTISKSSEEWSLEESRARSRLHTERGIRKQPWSLETIRYHSWWSEDSQMK